MTERRAAEVKSRTRIDLQSLLRVTELAEYVIPFTIRVICELRVADHLAGGSLTVTELAERTRTHAPSLHRALRALAHRGIFAAVEPGSYGLTPLSELLRTDHSLSLSGAFAMLPADVQAWAALDHTLRTGEPAFDHVHHLRYYDYLAARPDDSLRVDASVESVNRLVLRTVARAYDWASIGTLVDVGGGNGSFLAGLLARYKTMRGVLLDLPSVVAGAPRVLAAAGVTDRCDVVAGDFFHGVPAGADAYLLKTILHDWDDDTALRILRAARAGMRPDSKLLVLEAIIPPGDAFDVGKLMDVHSLVLCAGPDRGAAEFDGLFARAQLARTGTFPTSNVLTIMEARAA
ncbi:MAG: methyltransferase [Candidatus Eremiobacteraeota bacterium]|nr:methyltransferase [Candidatus Eremiobacteraeota bacterium]